MRVFGCTNFVHIKRKDKLKFVSEKTIFQDTHFIRKVLNARIQLIKKCIFLGMYHFFEEEPYFKEKEAIYQTYINNQNNNLVIYLDNLNFDSINDYQVENNNQED